MYPVQGTDPCFELSGTEQEYYDFQWAKYLAFYGQGEKMLICREVIYCEIRILRLLADQVRLRHELQKIRAKL